MATNHPPSNSHPFARPVIPAVEATSELIKFILMVLNITIDKFDRHSIEDIQDVVIFLIREITNIAFKLME